MRGRNGHSNIREGFTLKRTITLLLVVAMMIGLVMPVASADYAADEVVTLQMFSMPSNTSGLQESYYWTDILAQKVGVAIELLPSGDQGEQQLAKLMAANELPDVVVLKEYKHVVDAIAADLLLCLDDYQTELNDAFTNIPTAIQYFRDNVSNGTGKAYAFPNDVAAVSQTTGDTDFGPFLRWDLYKEIGMPVINTFEDLLPVLQQMLEIYPVNEDGQKVYGFSLWTDWDNISMQSAGDFYAYYGHGQFGFLDVDYATNEFSSIFAEDGLYKRWLQLLFDANQLGLVDPDSLSQRWNDYLDKHTAGRALYSNWSWGFGNYNTPERVEAGIGFQPVYVQDVKIERGSGPNYIGSAWPYAISKNTQNLDAALRFVNWMYSHDGLWLMEYGEQGIYWDVDADGPYKTEFGFKMDADPTLEFDNGGRASNGISVINSAGMSGRAVNPTYGYTRSALDWQKKDFAPADTALVADWKETMGIYDGTIAYLKSKDMMIEKDFAPQEPDSDEVTQINTRIGDVCKTNSWLMVFAKDQAEFDALWADMVDKAEGMNVQASLDATIANYKNGLEFGSKYMN